MRADGQDGIFPPYLRNDFDYASFARFDAEVPPKDLIYQSNGFMALQEKGFGGETVIIPVSGGPVPTNSTDRVLAVVLEAPIFESATGTFGLADSPAKRHLTYFADRTIYRAEFENGPEVSVEVYPVYGKSVSVVRIKVEKGSDVTRITLNTHGAVLQEERNGHTNAISYGSPRWAYRVLIAPGRSQGRSLATGDLLTWQVQGTASVAAIVALGADLTAPSSVK